MCGHLLFAAASNTTDVVIDIDGYLAPVSGSTRGSKTRAGRDAAPWISGELGDPSRRSLGEPPAMFTEVLG